MKILFRPKTKDGAQVVIWEDGRVSLDPNHDIQGIGRKTLNYKLDLFARDVPYYNLDELPAVFNRYKEQKKTAAQIVLQHFIQSDLKISNDYKEYLDLAVTWLKKAEKLANDSKLDSTFRSYLKEAENFINLADKLLGRVNPPIVVKAEPRQSVISIFKELNKTIKTALRSGSTALTEQDTDKAKKASRELGVALKYIRALRVLARLPL